MKVRRPTVTADGGTAMVCPEKVNRTPRRFKEAGLGGDETNQKNETKQESITAYLEHTDSEVEEVGVAEARKKKQKELQTASRADAAHAVLATELKKAYRMRSKEVEFEKGPHFEHLIKLSRHVDGGRQMNDRIERALFKMVKRSTADEKVIKEMTAAAKRKSRDAKRERVRAHTLLQSQHDEQVPCVDLDKRQFIIELLKMFTHVDAYMKKKEYLALSNLGMTIGFLGVILRQYNFVMKVYSMFAQIFMVYGQYKLALDFYNRLRNCAHTAKDIVVKMYSYKQMGHCYGKQEKYDEAIVCFKHLLALAWTTSSLEAEQAAYEALSLMHFYTGNIEKSKFFDHCYLNGITEP